MGWFFNRNNNNSDQNSHSDSSNHSQSQYRQKKSFYSKKRSCQNDPEDDQYMICKTIIKDNDGTREEEERIPRDSAFKSSSSQSNFSFSIPGSLPFRNPVQDDEKAFDKFQSFFIQPSFFDFHNSAQHPRYVDQSDPNNQIESYSRSFIQSRTCHTDPEDNEYLICKSKVQDGNETKEIEQRVKASDQFVIPSFRGEFANVGHQIDQQMHNLVKDLNQGFNFMMPFVGSVLNFVNDIENLSNGNAFAKSQPGQNYFPRNYQENTERTQQDSNSYFNSNRPKKDTNIYDL